MAFERVGIRPAEILLPAEGIAPETWACIACDQYTSEPEYWAKADALVGDAPSALRLILPECYLRESESRIPVIHARMASDLQKGVLVPAVSRGFVLCERQTGSGVRRGLVCAVDLEDYSFDRNAKPLIRPTEETVASRLPPRLVIRRGAPVELSHIMILIDDPDRTVLEPLAQEAGQLRKLYDFETMLGGGHLTGYAVEREEDLARIDSALNRLLDRLLADPESAEDGHPLLLAVGDGNHSLATAKAYWEEIRSGLTLEARENHPARFALCEIVNIHDEALRFEPIHRLITGATREELLADWERWAAERGMALEIGETVRKTKEAHCFEVVSPEGTVTVAVQHPSGAIPCQTIQTWLDDHLARHPEREIDYIHGDASLTTLAKQPGAVGFLLPEIDKNSFFSDVKKLGVLPRKTFSMGEADEKRFYMEAKEI